MIKMKELYKKKDYHGLKLEGLTYDDRSQAVIFKYWSTYYIQSQ